MASFSERYHEYTKYNPETISKVGPVDYSAQAPLFKNWGDGTTLSLIPWLNHLKNDVDLPIWKSETPTKITPEYIAAFCYYSMGITAIAEQGREVFYFRANPSAGGLYPAELTVAIRDTDGIADGIYGFSPLHNSLTLLHGASVWPMLEAQFFDHPGISQCQVLLIFGARLARSQWRYRERAYRRILLDVGHAAANAQILAKHWGFGHTWADAFHDERLARLLGQDPDQEPLFLALALSDQTLSPQANLRNPSPQQTISQAADKQGMTEKQLAVERMFKPESALEPPQIALPEYPNWAKEIDWPEQLRTRRSCRIHNPLPLNLQEITAILAFAHAESGLDLDGLLETHLVARNVDGVEQGVYKLEWSDGKANWNKTHSFFEWEPYHLACLGQDVALNCSAMLVHSTPLAELTLLRGDRGYRTLTLEAGRIGERINAAGAAAGIGISGVGGYYDDLLAELFGLERNHAILFVTSLGRVHEEDSN
jgi:SagB-type dehydrogenase family enzyme